MVVERGNDDTRPEEDHAGKHEEQRDQEEVMKCSLFLGLAVTEVRVSYNEYRATSDAHTMMNTEMVNNMRNMPAESAQ